MQHGDDAFHLEDDAMHGHERLPNVLQYDDGENLQAMRNEDDWLFRSLLHHDL